PTTMQEQRIALDLDDVLFIFFFSSRRRHTRFSRDWSSDVCSSDLKASMMRRWFVGRLYAKKNHRRIIDAFKRTLPQAPNSLLVKIGRASCRESVENSVVGGSFTQKQREEVRDQIGHVRRLMTASGD